MAEFFRNSAFTPAIVCLLCLALASAAGAWRWKVPWKLLSLVLIIGLTVAALAYLFLPVLAEDTETDIAAIAALAMRGEPVYPAPDSAARYILLYGPLTYLSHIPFYAFFGKNLFAFKLPGFLAFLATIFCSYAICRRFADRGAALVGCGAAGLLLFRYVPIPFWGRIDSLLFGAVAVAYWCAIRRSLPVAVAATALAIGIVPNLKFTAALYLVPLLFWMWMERGKWSAVIAAIGGALLVPLPFLLPVVSFRHYLFILHVVGRHGLDSKILLRNFQYVPILLAPVLLFYFGRGADRERKSKTLYLTSIAGCMLLSSVFGAKAGAGSYHLLPYVIPLLHLYFWIRSAAPANERDVAFSRYAVAWALTILIFSGGQVHILIDCLRDSRRGGEAIAQIDRTEAKYRGENIAVGPGSDFTDPRTLYAYLPILRGQPYVINSSAIRDLQFGGVAIPQSTRDYFETCGTPVWLIPAGQTPFSALNTYYAQPHPAFDDTFRADFLRHYRRAESGSQFDVWVCKHPR
jgi:hypothetical protein